MLNACLETLGKKPAGLSHNIFFSGKQNKTKQNDEEKRSSLLCGVWFFFTFFIDEVLSYGKYSIEC